MFSSDVLRRKRFHPVDFVVTLWNVTHVRCKILLHVFMILPKYNLYYIFLYSLESALSAQFQGEISQSNVKCDKFYKRLKLIFYSPTIIVKSVGKVAIFTSSFPSSPRPWSNVDQNVDVCARNCSFISQHWIGGTGDIYQKRKLSFFRIKMD